MSVGVALLLWWRSLGRGEFLYRDFVTAPVPARPASWFPGDYASLRAWPLDALTWLLAPVVPAGVQQLAVLLAVPVLAGTGVAVLVSRWGPLPAAVSAAVAVWNPYVAERLLMGQAPTLLAYAAAPWVALAARSRAPLPRRVLLVLLAALPAALTPWGGLVALATALGAGVTRHDRRGRELAALAVLGIGWCLPWLLPSLVAASGGHADPDGGAAFALRDDTGLGTWWSALTGGGIWSESAALASRRDLTSSLASALVLALACAGALTLRGRRRLLALTALVLPASLAALLSGPLVGVVTALQAVPGLALVRDQHRLLGLAVLAQAGLAGLAVGRTKRSAPFGRPTAAAVAVAVTAALVGMQPDLTGRLAQAYRPITYPAGWQEVVGAVEQAGSHGRRPVVLSMPWQPLRRTVWAGESSFLDPSPRGLPATVVTSSALRVTRDGRLRVVDDHPVPHEQAWSEGRLSAQALRSQGVTLVLAWVTSPGTQPVVRPGWRELARTPDWVLWDVTRAE